MLDRWSVSVVTTGKGGFRKAQKDRQLIMNNYLGIGVDGQVALDFHKVFTATNCSCCTWWSRVCVCARRVVVVFLLCVLRVFGFDIRTAVALSCCSFLCFGLVRGFVGWLSKGGVV